MNFSLKFKNNTSFASCPDFSICNKGFCNVITQILGIYGNKTGAKWISYINDTDPAITGSVSFKG